MKKILLFSPYYSQRTKHHFYKPTPPIGLMYLSAYLKKKGLESKIYDLGIFSRSEIIEENGVFRFGKSDAEILEIIESEKPDIVGITCMYSIYYHDVVKICSLIKNYDKKIKIILGGNHASSYWKAILRNKDVDIVIVGEGEQTFYQICISSEFKNINGIAYRDAEGNAHLNSPRDLLSMMDIPIPDYEAIDLYKYIEIDSVFSIRHGALGVVSSRGCPAKCKFCTIKAVWGGIWRGQAPNVFVDELELLVRKYGVKEFAFLDDSASVNKERWMKISDEIINRKLDIKWSTPNGIAHWTLDEDILDKMKQSGCYRVTFGIESGNKRIRKYINKPGSLDRAKRMIAHANKIGMWTICTHIIGFPDETYEEMLDTLNFAKSCDTDFATFYLLIPQPTSDIYPDFKRLGLLNLDEYFETDNFNTEEFTKINEVLNETGCDTKFFKKEEISKIQKDFYRKFMIHRGIDYVIKPWKIIRKIRSWEDFEYVMRLLMEGIKIFRRTLSEHNNRTGDYLYKEA